MKLYRIARSIYSEDLSGEGARKFGGRWNKKGVGMVYSSEHESLAALEVLAHISTAATLTDLQLVELRLADSVTEEKLSESTLPNNWRSYPAPAILAEIGSEWILSKRSLLLKVPSVLAPSEYNVLINPYHAEAKRIKIINKQEFKFDHRLIP